MYDEILYEVDDPVATITLNRPDQLNAWTNRMGSEVRHAVATAEADPAVVGIVITGAGRGFCAGADMKTLTSITEGGTLAADEGELPPAPASAAAAGRSRRRVHLPARLPEADHRRHQRRLRRDGGADRAVVRCAVHGRGRRDAHRLRAAGPHRRVGPELAAAAGRRIRSGDGHPHLVAQGQRHRGGRDGPGQQGAAGRPGARPRPGLRARHGGPLLADIDLDHEAPGVRASCTPGSDRPSWRAAG